MSDSYSPLDDATLARLARRDEQAFEALVKRHAASIHRLAASTVGPGAADDVVQDVFISVHKGLKSFRGDAQFSTWLHRITLNACYKALQARQHVPFDMVAEPTAPHDPLKSSERQQVRERVADALQTLPHDQREALSLREISGLEYAEIAQILGVRPGTVKSRINRGRSALRALLGGRGERDE